MPRKGALRRADIPAEVLMALQDGSMETATLAEGLAIDFAVLFRAAVPRAGAEAADMLAAAAGEGVSRRMALAGTLLTRYLDFESVDALGRHPSDTVRGWVAYAWCARPGLSLAARLDLLRPLADDPHFAVREWSWMALRPHIADDLAGAIDLLVPWTAERSLYLRRFASEATRPRGVWCAHLERLKHDPGLGLPILEPLRADPSHYVEDSVGNWLNDAAKTRPDWVRRLCARWKAESPCAATDRIRARALRTIGVD